MFLLGTPWQKNGTQMLKKCMWCFCLHWQSSLRQNRNSIRTMTEAFTSHHLNPLFRGFVVLAFAVVVGMSSFCCFPCLSETLHASFRFLIFGRLATTGQGGPKLFSKSRPLLLWWTSLLCCVSHQAVPAIYFTYVPGGTRKIITKPTSEHPTKLTAKQLHRCFSHYYDNHKGVFSRNYLLRMLW